MRPMIRTTLSVMTAIAASAGIATALAQAAGKPAAVSGQSATACGLLSAKEIQQISKRDNRLNLPPESDSVSKDVTECHYLGFDFSLTRGMTREWFDGTKNRQVKSGTKIQPVSGLGDDAYFWQPPSRSDALVGIVFRVGQSRLAIQDMVSPDSVEAVKPVLLALAKAAAQKLR